MDGPQLMKMFVNANVRKIAHLDALLENWDRLFFLKRADKTMPTSTFYYTFMHMLLYDRMALRIENNFIYFQANDIVRMSLTQFSETENLLFLQKWFLIFKTQKVVDSITKTCDYKECLLNNVLEQCFPRFQICARFMCLSLRQAHADKDTFLDTWHAFNDVAIKLLTAAYSHEQGKALLRLLHEPRHMAIYTTWNDQVEVYPGANIDKL